jgi:hypothetical protein
VLTGLFDLISGLYALAALYTLRELWVHRRELGDGVFSPAERRLGEMVGFLLLTPVGVLVHEAAHWAVARALGASDAAISFRLYWGYVSYSARLAPEDAWLVAVAGPLASMLVGFGAVLVALRVAGFPRAALASFGQATLMLVLVAYPAMSFLGFFGDFLVIYLFGGWERAAGAAAVHAVGLFLALRLLRRFEWWSAPAASAADDGLPAVAGDHAARAGDAGPRGEAPAASELAPEQASAATTGRRDAGAQQPAPRRVVGPRAWLAWTVATALGLVVGKLLAPTAFLVGAALSAVAAAVAGAGMPAVSLQSPGGLAAYGAAIGASVGWTQYVLLHRWYPGNERWIGLSLLGGAVGGVVGSLVGVAIDELVAVGVGAGQALVLQRTRRAALWAPGGAAVLSGAGLALAAAGVGVPQPLDAAVDGGDLARWLATGLLYGAVTGALLLVRPRPAG